MRATTVALLVAAAAALVLAAAYAQTQHSASAGYSVAVNATVEVGLSPARRINYTASIVASMSAGLSPAHRIAYSLSVSASASVNGSRVQRRMYVIYSNTCLSVNVTRASGATEVVLRDFCVSSGIALTISTSYSGYLCTDLLDDYVVVVDRVSGMIVASVYMGLSDVQTVVLPRSNYTVVFPRTARCATGNCVGSLSSIVVGGSVYQTNVVNLSLATSTTVRAAYSVQVVPPCQPALLAYPFSSVVLGSCPDDSGTCYWFGTSIAVKYTCTVIGDTIITVYEYQHQEEVRIAVDGRGVAVLQPSSHHSYRVRMYRVSAPCPMCVAAASASCRLTPLSPQQQQGQTAIGMPQFTAPQPQIDVAVPSVVSPQGLIMSAALVCLFAFLSKRVRWTVALFVTSIVMSALGMLVLGSVEMFAVGIVVSVVSIALDKYL